MPKFCTKCGTPLRDGMIRCPNCGKELVSNSKEQSNDISLNIAASMSEKDVEAAITRAEILIGDGDFLKANTLLERAVNFDPKNSKIYLLFLLIDLGYKNVNELKEHNTPLNELKNYVKAYDFANDIEKKELDEINNIIKKRINDELDKKYNSALELKEDKKYKEAEELFTSLKKHKDSIKQAEECQNLQKEEIYQSSIIDNEINNDNDVKLYQTSIDKLSSISEYKDASKIIKTYKGKIKCYQDEQERIRKEEEEKKKALLIKKTKKVSLIAGPIALVLIGSLLLTFLYFVPEGKQTKLQELIDSKEYYEALEVLDDLGNYGDHSNLEDMLYAGLAFKEGDYEQGINLIYNIGGTVDVNYNTNGGTASKTSETIKRAYINNDPKKDGYIFSCWTLNDYNLKSSKHYAEIDLNANYISEEEIAWNIAHGVTPTTSSDSKTITYGLYPQTNVNDSSLIAELNKLTTIESNGWYLYNNEYYAKLVANPDLSDYIFDNGTTIVEGTNYWFKCEPITWNILSNDNGEYYLLSNVLLDKHGYDNNGSYEYSEIRTWLNNDFYNSAFALNNSYIKTTDVDNSPSTTDSSIGFGHDNTQDKVFLPSYKDYKNSGYGFSYLSDSDGKRCCRTTDWARARGAWYYSSDSSYLYNGWYVTRSFWSQSSDFSWTIEGDGSLHKSEGCFLQQYDFFSVRPAITLKIV